LARRRRAVTPRRDGEVAAGTSAGEANGSGLTATGECRARPWNSAASGEGTPAMVIFPMADKSGVERAVPLGHRSQ